MLPQSHPWHGRNDTPEMMLYAARDCDFMVTFRQRANENGKKLIKAKKKRNAFACFKEQTAGAHKLANHNTNAQVAVNI